MARWTFSSGARVVVLHCLIAALLTLGLALHRGPEQLLYFLIAPVLLAALFYPRSVYLTMAAVAGLTAWAVLTELSNRPDRASKALHTVGPVVAVVVFLSEIFHQLMQARLRSEQELRQTSETFQALIAASPLAIFALDAQGQVRSWNAAAERLFGWSEREIVEGALPIVLEEEQEALVTLRDQVLRGVSFTDVEGRCRTRDGRLIDVLLSAAPIYRAGSTPAGMMALVADVTARKQAEENARRLHREQIARVEAEETQQRFAFLAEVGSLLAASLDEATTLDRVARLAVPQLADACLIDLVGAAGRIERVAVAHVDPEQEPLLRQLQPGAGPERSLPEPAARVLESGHPLIIPDVSEKLLGAAPEDAERVQLIRALGIRSYLGAPLVARGHTLGAISFLTAGSGRRYGAADLALAEELAARAAIAIDNARLYAEVQKAGQAKDEFLAMLAHELRNPLAAIANASYVLDRIPPDDPQAERLRATIARQTDHLGRLVDDLLDVSRIQRGKIELRKSRVELAPVVRQAVEMVRPLVEGRGHLLAVELPGQPVFLDADPTRLEQVLANLLNNAAKYTEPGGRIWLSVQIEEMGARTEDGRRQTTGGRREDEGTALPTSVLRPLSSVCISVRDSGMGIPPDVLPRIFDLFVQADRSLDRAQGGLGIGLTLVHRLVQLHGGSIEARSEGPGRGSEFVIRLPAATMEADGSAGALESWRSGLKPGPSGLQTSSTPALQPRPRRVLIVDDNPDALETLEDILRLWGYEARAAGDGAAALAAAREWPPDVVLLDIGLPGMDGYDVAHRLREEAGPRASRLQLIAVTGYGQETDRRRATEAGFDQHLVKPVDLAALRQLLAGPPETCEPALPARER
jgi:PAS domain S-box-containing protein